MVLPIEFPQIERQGTHNEHAVIFCFNFTIETNDSPDTSTKRTAEFNHDQDASVVPLPDEAIGEVLEWLTDVVANNGPISTRALAACAYDSLGGLHALLRGHLQRRSATWTRRRRWPGIEAILTFLRSSR